MYLHCMNQQSKVIKWIISWMAVRMKKRSYVTRPERLKVLTAWAASSIITTSYPQFNLLKRLEPLKLRVEKTCQSYCHYGKQNDFGFHFQRRLQSHTIAASLRIDERILSLSLPAAPCFCLSAVKFMLESFCSTCKAIPHVKMSSYQTVFYLSIGSQSLNS